MKNVTGPFLKNNDLIDHLYIDILTSLINKPWFTTQDIDKCIVVADKGTRAYLNFINNDDDKSEW